MKLLSQKKALENLKDLKADFKALISSEYEYRAKSCLTCEVQGACCLDEHFVNVHISRLEAVAINARIDSFPEDQRRDIRERIDSTIVRYGLSNDGDTFDQKFSCPLFEKSKGCLIHDDGKPVACMVHACYESEADLPPGELQLAQERRIDNLNSRTYGRRDQWLPLPLAINISNR